MTIPFLEQHHVAAESPIADQVHALLPQYVGAAVMAVDDGRTIFKHAWGDRRLGAEGPCTPRTNFRLASVSKHFTATAVMRLVDRGDICLHDTIDQFFPEGPAYWKEITVHHLLTHTSGLPDYEELIPPGTTLQLSDFNVLELLRNTDKPLFPPGSTFRYSNSGYAVLGLLVEVAACCPFHDFLQHQVLRPAGMNRSVLYVAGINTVPERAFGHLLADNDTWSVSDQSLTSAVRGDGGVYSSLEDLEIWLDVLSRGGLLTPSSAALMEKPHVKTDRGNDDYGYGWFVGTYRGQRRLMHAGSTRGFSLMLQRFPERKAAVVILLNRSDSDPPGDYVQKIVDRLLFEPAR